jgi:hypothetical protein
MTPETLAKLAELKAVVSTIKEAELRLERARTELAQADLNLARVQSAKRAMAQTLQDAVNEVVLGIAFRKPAAETKEYSEIVEWFTSDE